MTKEEAAIIIHKLKQDVLTGAVRKYEPFEGEVLLGSEFYDAINMAIEALEQEPILDKIRAEIMDFEEDIFHSTKDYSDYAAVRHCVDIIDKYRGEVSE